MRIEIPDHWEFCHDSINSFFIVTSTYFDPDEEVHIDVYSECGSSIYYDCQEDFV